MLTLISRLLLSIICGAAKALRIFRALKAASSPCSTWERSTTNSSPPSRLTVSDRRTQAINRPATDCSSLSPTPWPSESLIFLKWSKSTNITASCLPWRSASAIACVSRSLNSTRFGKSVRTSCCAECAISSDLARAALTSWKATTAPVTLPSWSWISVTLLSIPNSSPSRRTRIQFLHLAISSAALPSCIAIPTALPTAAPLTLSVSRSTSPMGRPSASSRRHPVISSAIRFRYVTLLCKSVRSTPSPIESSVTLATSFSSSIASDVRRCIIVCTVRLNRYPSA